MDNDVHGAQQPQQHHQPSYSPQGFVAQNARPEYITQDHQLPSQGTPDPVPQHNPFMPPQPVYTPSAPEPAYAPQQSSNSLQSDAQDDKPVPVVKVLSVRGVEYAMMSIMLWIGAAALIILLSSLVLGSTGFDVLSLPLTLLVVSLPIFALFFIRLRKAELANPSLRLEPSKRRFSQITQFVTFLTCFFNLVALVYTIFSAIGGNGGSVGKTFGVTAIIFVVAGGIFTYYWRDEHKLVRR